MPTKLGVLTATAEKPSSAGSGGDLGELLHKHRSRRGLRK
jgi:hypothetical protein